MDDFLGDFSGSQTYANNFGISNHQELEFASFAWRRVRDEMGIPEGAFDAEHLIDIHRYYYGGLHDWAGYRRPIELNRFSHQFASRRDIDARLEKNAGDLYRDRRLRGSYDSASDQKKFLSDACEGIVEHFYDDYHTHPFFEGNTWTLQKFYQQRARIVGLDIDWNALYKHEGFSSAHHVALTQQNYQPMIALLKTAVKPSEKQAKDDFVDKRVRDFFNRGDRLYRAGKYAGARKEYHKVLKKMRGHTPTQMRLAMCEYGLEKYQDAQKIINDAIASDGKNALLYYAQAVISYGAKQPKKGKSNLRKALKYEKEYARPFLYQAIMQYDHNQYERALHYLDQSLAIDSTDPYVLAEKAFVLDELGRSEEALKTRQEVMRIYPGIVDTVPDFIAQKFRHAQQVQQKNTQYSVDAQGRVNGQFQANGARITMKGVQMDEQDFHGLGIEFSDISPKEACENSGRTYLGDGECVDKNKALPKPTSIFHRVAHYVSGLFSGGKQKPIMQNLPPKKPGTWAFIEIGPPVGKNIHIETCEFDAKGDMVCERKDFKEPEYFKPKILQNLEKATVVTDGIVNTLDTGIAWGKLLGYGWKQYAGSRERAAYAKVLAEKGNRFAQIYLNGVSRYAGRKVKKLDAQQREDVIELLLLDICHEYTKDMSLSDFEVLEDEDLRAALLQMARSIREDLVREGQLELIHAAEREAKNLGVEKNQWAKLCYDVLGQLEDFDDVNISKDVEPLEEKDRKLLMRVQCDTLSKGEQAAFAKAPASVQSIVEHWAEEVYACKHRKKNMPTFQPKDMPFSFFGGDLNPPRTEHHVTQRNPSLHSMRK